MASKGLLQPKPFYESMTLELSLKATVWVGKERKEFSISWQWEAVTPKSASIGDANRFSLG